MRIYMRKKGRGCSSITLYEADNINSNRVSLRSVIYYHNSNPIKKMIRLKTGQNGAIGCIHSNCDFMLLFGNESLTSLVDINIRHKWTC